MKAYFIPFWLRLVIVVSVVCVVIGGLLALLLDAPETWAWLARLAVSAPIWIIALCIHRSRAAFKAKGRSGSRRL